jgi:hypothetical protein
VTKIKLNKAVPVAASMLMDAVDAALDQRGLSFYRFRSDVPTMSSSRILLACTMLRVTLREVIQHRLMDHSVLGLILVPDSTFI